MNIWTSISFQNNSSLRDYRHYLSTQSYKRAKKRLLELILICLLTLGLTYLGYGTSARVLLIAIPFNLLVMLLCCCDCIVLDRVSDSDLLTVCRNNRSFRDRESICALCSRKSITGISCTDKSCILYFDDATETVINAPYFQLIVDNITEPYLEYISNKFCLHVPHEHSVL